MSDSSTPVNDITQNDRLSALLVFMMLIGSLTFGFLLRQQDTNEIWSYISREAGVEAYYPAGWLTDEQGAYVARIRDPKARPFKTQYVVTAFPYGPESSVRNVLDSVTIQRANDLSAYRVLSIQQISYGGVMLTQMDFAYVDADPNPFIQRLPVVVQGRDIVIIDGNRAIVVTFMSEQATFDENLPAFEQFLLSLRY